MDSAVLDDIIARLLEVRTGRPGKQVQLSEAEIRQLCVASKDIFFYPSPIFWSLKLRSRSVVTFMGNILTS